MEGRPLPKQFGGLTADDFRLHPVWLHCTAPSDVEWVYVALANDTYSEAVTVVVSQEESRLVIGSIEWGRP